MLNYNIDLEHIDRLLEAPNVELLEFFAGALLDNYLIGICSPKGKNKILSITEKFLNSQSGINAVRESESENENKILYNDFLKIYTPDFC